MMLPDLLDTEGIHARLRLIFPEGTPNRNYATRELAASTVFVALYVDAVDGTGVFFGPKHVYRMTDKQSQRTDEASRSRYANNIVGAGFQPPGKRWYSDNTREPIRDETLRDGLIALGAVIEKAGVPTSSSKPRYALATGFAALFDTQLAGKSLESAIAAWQTTALNPGALPRIALVRQGAAAGGSNVLVTFPNGETRRMVVGPSTDITKSVIEVFAPKFLQQPAVLFVSESGNKVVSRDDDLARSIGLDIEANKNLPDIILVDLGPEHPMLVFVEAVATDGPVNERRKRALEELATKAGFPLQHIAYVTAYLDRGGASFKKTVDALAWGSYAWFVSEPDGLIELKTGKAFR
ncbi:MAG TPA: BsuBI/PstI family type II restriction endonuclease [Bradyrhizobium sp.]|nr:BsuBI/PstI family type II restriction endonuclease [Bradyrhizobium sp.]